jgi:hypothetical protein
MPKAFGIAGVPKRSGGPLAKPPHGAVLDRQHPLAQGLDLSFHTVGRDFRSLAKNDSVAALTGTQVYGFRQGEFGTVFNGSSKLTLRGSNRYSSAGKLTIVYKIVSRVSHEGAIIRWEQDSSNGSWISADSGGLWGYVRNSDNTTSFSHSGHYPDGVMTETGIVYDGSLANANRVKVYRNGSPVSATINGTVPTSIGISSDAIELGGGPGSAYFLDGFMSYCFVWLGRALNPVEIAKFSRSPFQVFISPKRRVFFVPTGGGQALTKSVSDAITLGESTARATTFTRSSSDALTVGESTVRAATFNRSQSNALTLGESTTRAATFNRSASNALALGESTTRAATFNRTGSDALTLGDTLAKVATLFRSASESLTVGEATTRATTFTRSSTDALALGESTARQLNPGGNALTQSVSDGLTLGESTSRVTTYTRSTSDALTVGESTVTLRCRYVSKADALTLGDTSARVTTYARTSTDTLTLGDVSARVATLFRSRSDSITLGDTDSGAATLRRSTADALTVGESSSPVRGRIASATDALSLDDAEGSELLIGTGDPTAPYICLSPYRISRSPALQHQAVKGQYDPRLKSRPVS